MKMMYNGIPIKSLNIKHFEVSTNDATLRESDMQTGVTAYARGRKVVGTGKAFEFANYGGLVTNTDRFVPNDINVIEISSINYPIKSNFELQSMKNIDFSNTQNIATVVIDGNEYDLIVSVKSNTLTISCDKTIELQVFYGKDNYV